MSHLPGKFVWFEHVSSDIGKARAFYEPLFDWHVESMPMGGESYSMIMTAGNQGIGGLTKARPGAASHWQSYLSVADVDASHAAAIAAGAKSQMAPVDFGKVGRGAALTDPTGAAFSLWHSADADRPDAEQTPIGEWYWNELWTPDAKTALAFYERVFGYAHDAMDMGSQGTYYLLKSPDGKARGGLMQSQRPEGQDDVAALRGRGRLRCQRRQGRPARRAGGGGADRHPGRRPLRRARSIRSAPRWR